MGSEPLPAITLQSLQHAREQEELVVRWLRPLAPLVMAIVLGAAFVAHPSPGLTGEHLAVTLGLGVFSLGGAGALTTLRRAAALNIAFIAVLLLGSLMLLWVQPDGTSIAGIFVAVSLLAGRVHWHLSVPIVASGLLMLAVVFAIESKGSLTSALLNAVMLGAFYGVLLLAMRLGEANELAEQLLIELERSRAAEARAAGLAERERLAREMHDVLAHSLSGLMLQLEAARMLAAGNPADGRLPEVIDRAHHLGKTGLEEARRAIGMLRGDDLPGPERLDGLAAQFEEDRAIPCAFTVTGEQHELGPEARLALYRVAQEALTNIAKHANPQRVELHLAYEPGTTRLTVEDFAATDEPHSTPVDGGGYGLTGMRERAELLGGTLTTATTSSGFRVELAVPA
jgi:signal transduction histidine kinase